MWILSAWSVKENVDVMVKYWFNPGEQEVVPLWPKNCWLEQKASTQTHKHLFNSSQKKLIVWSSTSLIIASFQLLTFADPESFVRGVQFCFLVDEGIEDLNAVMFGPSSARQWNAITMAFCWQAYAGPTLNASDGSFVIFQGIRTSIAKKSYMFVIFQGGGGGSGPPVPPSGSAYVWHDFLACILLVLYPTSDHLTFLNIQAQSHPEYQGPMIWPRKSEANRRTWTDDQLKAGQQVISLQYGSNKGASQAGMNFGKARMILDWP